MTHIPRAHGDGFAIEYVYFDEKNTSHTIFSQATSPYVTTFVSESKRLHAS